MYVEDKTSTCERKEAEKKRKRYTVDPRLTIFFLKIFSSLNVDSYTEN